MSTSSPRVSLLTRSQCHLCTAARQTLDDVCAEFGLGWEELEEADHPELVEQFSEEIPVLFIDGTQRDFWQIDPYRLRGMLERAGAEKAENPSGGANN